MTNEEKIELFKAHALYNLAMMGVTPGEFGQMAKQAAALGTTPDFQKQAAWPLLAALTGAGAWTIGKGVDLAKGLLAVSPKLLALAAATTGGLGMVGGYAAHKALAPDRNSLEDLKTEQQIAAFRRAAEQQRALNDAARLSREEQENDRSKLQRRTTLQISAT